MPGAFKLEGKHGRLAEKTLTLLGWIFEKFKIDYILEGGTLLGIIREDRLLPWDTDIDISARSDQANKIVKVLWIFWLFGYQTSIKRFSRDVGPFKKGGIRIIKIRKHFLYYKKYELVDIFIKYEVDEEFLNVVGLKPAIVRNFPKKYLLEYDYVNFRGQQLKVPIDVKEYLTLVYGDWETPVKEWDYKKDNKRIKQVIERL